MTSLQMNENQEMQNNKRKSLFSFYLRFCFSHLKTLILNAAACIFLGQTEAAILIEPTIHFMTESEIHAIVRILCRRDLLINQ
jgi:hypothetical protein